MIFQKAVVLWAQKKPWYFSTVFRNIMCFPSRHLKHETLRMQRSVPGTKFCTRSVDLWNKHSCKHTKQPLDKEKQRIIVDWWWEAVAHRQRWGSGICLYILNGHYFKVWSEGCEGKYSPLVLRPAAWDPFVTKTYKSKAMWLLLHQHVSTSLSQTERLTISFWPR